MKMDLETANIATAIVLIVVVLVGAALVILSAVVSDMDPAIRIGYRDYIEAVSIAVAGLAVGRGLAARHRR